VQTSIRFHLDESVTTVLARLLRQRGIDVTLPADAALIGASDEQHLYFARQNDRVLVTHDVDFLRLDQGGAEHAGIVYCHQSKYAVSELLQTLLLVHSAYTSKEMPGRVEYV
jgi:predicted nuclease of predicted toxin-antitoxin system